MSEQKRYEIMTSEEIEYWNVELEDGSILKILADGYSIERDEIVFNIGVKSDVIENLETLRIPLFIAKEDYSHWNGDSFDYYPAVINKVNEGLHSLREVKCGYCDRKKVLNLFVGEAEKGLNTVVLWCEFCWHNLESKTTFPFEWSNKVELNSSGLPSSPKTLLEMKIGRDCE